jgi:hypothetical protein
MRLLIISILGATTLGIATLTGPACAADARTATGFPGKTQLQFRFRSEGVEEAGFASDALASTFRTRLTWTSPGWRGWQATAELDDIRALDADAYNSTVNGQGGRPVVPDAVDTELNRAVLEWKHPRLDLALGRQRLALDNQRFIGNVAWRQNEQTVDGVSLRWHATSRAEVTAAWVTNVNRVYGPRSGTQSADWHGDSAILHGRADLGRFGTLSAFWHGLEFDNSAATSVSTTGMLWSGIARPGDGWRLPWAASLAYQRDYGRNPSDYSAHYRQLELGVGRGPATLKVGLESLGGDPTRPDRRFQTPLATLHVFQGWADKFLATPPQGIDDRYVAIEATLQGFTAVLGWHDFRAEAVPRPFGREWDLSISRKLGDRCELLGKFADYRAAGFATDTRKAWLMLTATL